MSTIGSKAVTLQSSNDVLIETAQKSPKKLTRYERPSYLKSHGQQNEQLNLSKTTTALEAYTRPIPSSKAERSNSKRANLRSFFGNYGKHQKLPLLQVDNNLQDGNQFLGPALPIHDAEIQNRRQASERALTTSQQVSIPRKHCGPEEQPYVPHTSEPVTYNCQLEQTQCLPNETSAEVIPSSPIRSQGDLRTSSQTTRGRERTGVRASTSSAEPINYYLLSEALRQQNSMMMDVLREFYVYHPDLQADEGEPFHQAVRRIAIKLHELDEELRKTKGDAIRESQDASERYQSEILVLEQRLETESLKHARDTSSLRVSIDILEKEKSDLERRFYNVDHDRKEIEKKLRTEILELKKYSDEEKKELQDRLNEQHKVDTQKLRWAAEDLKQAFVAREHFRGMRDRDITGRFSKLATEVEDISTLEWSNPNVSRWPLSENQLLKMHPGNIRLLKQQIVQSSIWLLLYEHIMQSPFKIMGTAGQDADETWLEIWDSDNPCEWPEVSTEMERSRSEQAREFLSAIEPSTKTTPENAGLKISHENAVSAALKELRGALGRVMILSDRDQKILDNIVRLCAKTWLECCSQKYRLIMVLPDGIAHLLLHPEKEARPIRLLVKPDIKRFGTSQGEGLTTGEAVTGWKSVVERYPIQ
ncbi:hypothetical protein OPT61_g6032 [Boeremia exigua]|uniref:Uncharacterized protein n=1 Tax=Boeremia exigua TaxID=749465 RepID=A0ACC2I8B9_9PLEO|nr:hypothetical protein OPT61_g6032 [Boeremia exigua]